MVKPPVVFVAGMLRALRRAIDTEAWNWLCEGAGQRLFYPPDVSGWEDTRWLDTSTIRGRWELVNYALQGRELQDGAIDGYDSEETPEQGVALARSFWGDPNLTAETVGVLTAFAAACVEGPLASWEERAYRGLRQNALRQLVYFSPDLQAG